HTLDGLSFPRDGSVAAAVTGSGKAILVRDVEETSGPALQMARSVNARSTIVAPIVDRTKTIGVLAVMSAARNSLDDEDLFVVKRFADRASLAIKNANTIALEVERARMEAELTNSQLREELRSHTIRAVIRAQEDER